MSRASWVLCAVIVSSGSTGCALLGGGKPRAPFKDTATGLELVEVKGGCFQMGNTFESGGPEERPAHEVCVDDFWMGRHEVTQGQWKAVMGSNPSQHAACGETCPVEMVSWNDAQEFLARLNARGGGLGPPGPYRLPTEAEWEYAARSGGKQEKYAGTTDDVGSVAWFLWNTEVTQPVGQKAPNGLGLHDMTGNVWEWTADWYSDTAYAGSLRKNPTGPATGDRRVARGGSYVNEAYDVRAAYRNYLPPDYRGAGKGLRLVKAPPPQPK